jgi:hypothetical protein
MDRLHVVKLRHGTDDFTSPPKEGVLRIFFALKIRQLQPGANPQTWVPKASTLPLDYQSRYSGVICCDNIDEHVEKQNLGKYNTDSNKI